MYSGGMFCPAVRFRGSHYGLVTSLLHKLLTRESLGSQLVVELVVNGPSFG